MCVCGGGGVGLHPSGALSSVPPTLEELLKNLREESFRISLQASRRGAKASSLGVPTRGGDHLSLTTRRHTSTMPRSLDPEVLGVYRQGNGTQVPS